MTDDVKKAKQLAKMIALDLRVSHRAELEAGTDLSLHVEVGRTVFRRRVSPNLYPMFEQALRGELGRGKLARYALEEDAGQVTALAPPPSVERASTPGGFFESGPPQPAEPSAVTATQAESSASRPPVPAKEPTAPAVFFESKPARASRGRSGGVLVALVLFLALAAAAWFWAR